METYYTDNQSYAGATTAKIKEIEPAVGNFESRLDLGTPTATGYTVKVTSRGSNAVEYSITNASGVVTRTCGPAAKQGKGGCPSNGSW
jgi:hypothetical protein